MKRVIATLITLAMVLAMVPMSAFAAVVAKETNTIVGGWDYQLVNCEAGAVIDTAQGVKGKGSLKLFLTTDTDNGYIWARTTASVEKGKSYKLKFDVKMQNAGKNTNVLFDWDRRISLVPTGRTYDWSTYEFTYNATETKTLELRWSLDDVTEAMWVDNVVFYDVTAPEKNLVTNGDFESGATAQPVATPVPQSGSKGSFDVFEKTITVDGKLNDWDGVEIHEITQIQSWGAEIGQLIKANVRLAYDATNFYFAIEVTDDVHFPDKDTYWNGDGVQFTVAEAGSVGRAGKECAVVYHNEKDEVVIVGNVFTADATREGNKTVYEVSFPFEENFGAIPSSYLFNAIINNNDGDGRYCLEITEGIADGKNVHLFKEASFWQPVGGVIHKVDCPLQMEMDDKGTLTANLRNVSNAAKTVAIEIPALNVKETVTLKSGEERAVPVSFNIASGGEHYLDVTLTCDGEEDAVSRRILGVHNAGSYPALKAKLQGFVTELKDLIYQCEAKKFPLEYESSEFAIIVRFMELMDDEAAHDYYSNMHEYERNLTEMYNTAKTNMEAYLAGTKKPLSVPKYVSGDTLRMEGTTMYALTDNNGVQEERPVFFQGYGNWQTIPKELEFFKNIGVNSFETEITRCMREVFTLDDVYGWRVWDVKETAEVLYTMTDAEKYSGTKSVKVTANTDKDKGSKYIYQEIPVKPGTTYEYGLKAKGTQTNNKGIWMNMNNVDMVNRKWIGSSPDWMSHDYEYTTADNQTDLKFVIMTELNQTDGMYLDDVYIREKGTSKNLLWNGNFDDPYEKTELDYEAERQGFHINQASLQWLRDVAADAEQHGMIFNIGCSIHYLPTFFKYDEEVTAGGTGFTPFSFKSPKLNQAITLWAKVLGEIAAENDSLKGFMVMNEPAIHSNFSDHYVPEWQAYLKNLYGTIDKLNAQYGSDYKSFEDVKMPYDAKDKWATFPTPLYYDYRSFNDEMFYNWIDWLFTQFRDANSEVLLFNKIMDYLRLDYKRYFNEGTNWEKLSKITDVNGCDAHSYYTNANTPMQLKMGWFDFMTSVKDTPVWDTETHIIDDNRTIQYDFLSDYYTSADVYNSAIHGRGNVVHWLWDLRDAQRPWGDSNAKNANYVFRPGAVSKNAKAGFDLNRLGYEVEALQKVDAKAAILYSRTTGGYNSDFMNVLYKAHEGLLFSGQNVDFVTESELAKMHDYELLIVPEVTNTQKATLEEIKKFMDNGGTVLILGNESLKKNEYDKAHDETLVQDIYDRAITNQTVRETVQKLALSQVELIDVETGKYVDDVEWFCAEYKGNILVHVSNYHRKFDRTVKVVYQGEELEEVFELRANETLKGEITLKPYQPIMLQFSK